MSKIDYKKEMKDLYKPSKVQIVSVKVPKLNFLMVDGKGDPNKAKEYQDAIETLYAMSYKIKFISKKENGNDFVVMPLEGLWWSDDMATFSPGQKDDWKWTAMIMQPDVIDTKMFEIALKEVKAKKDLPSLSKIRFESYEEGLSAQVMYLGAYTDEAPTIAKIHKYIKKEGYKLTKKHHEIYLSDPRRVAPEKLKTIIRQPMSK